MKVGSRFAVIRYPVDRTNSGTIDQNDPLIALPHGRQIGLHHDRFTADRKEHLKKTVHILIIGRQTEHTSPAITK